MSIQLIQQYHAKVEQMIRYGGMRNLRTPQDQDMLEREFESTDAEIARLVYELYGLM